MHPDQIGELVNAAILLLVGLYATLQGFRRVGSRSGASTAADHWHARYGQFFRVSGPVLIISGAVMISATLVRGPARLKVGELENWVRVTTSDGICSAEFPRPPTHQTKTIEGIEMDNQTLSLKKLDVYYTLSFSDAQPGAPAVADEEMLDMLRDTLAGMHGPDGSICRIVHEDRVAVAGVPGRDLEFRAGDHHTLRARIFIRGRRNYRALTVYPPSEPLRAAAGRFLGSVMFTAVMP